MCRIELHNMKTGEVVACDTVKPLVSVVKKWAMDGMSEGFLRVAKSPAKNVRKYFKQVVKENTYGECDFCKRKLKGKELIYHCDQYEVCMFVECKDCNGIHEGRTV